jgi:hypothetical protein
LLGVPAPATAEGRTLVQVLALDDAGTGAALAAADGRRRELVGGLAAAGRARLAKDERRGRLARGAGCLAGIAALALAIALRRPGAATRQGLGRGVAAAALAIAALLAVVAVRSGAGLHLPTFSDFRHLARLGVETALFGLGAGAVMLARPVRAVWSRSLPPREAWRFAAAAALGATPPALAAFAATGMGAARFTCQPDWLAAGPMVAYALLGGTLLAIAAVPLVAATRR